MESYIKHEGRAFLLSHHWRTKLQRQCAEEGMTINGLALLKEVMTINGLLITSPGAGFISSDQVKLF